MCKAHLFPQMTAKVRAARNDKSNDGKDGSKSFPSAITRGTTILSLTTEELRFLDIALYAPGTSLDSFIKAFNRGGEAKGIFPYESIKIFLLLLLTIHKGTVYVNKVYFIHLSTPLVRRSIYNY